MAETTSPRFGMTIWGAPTDGPSRVEFNAIHNAVETLAVIGKSGALGSRPSAGVRDTYYWDTDNKFLWRDNGTGWDLTTSNTRDMLVGSSAVGVIPLTVNAIASQTANLIDAQVNSSSKFSVTAAGNLNANVLNAKSASLVNDTTGNVVYYGKGAAGQTANLLTLQDSTGSNQFSISPTGFVTSPLLATTGSGASTASVLNANSMSNVAGFNAWSGNASAEVRMNRSGTFNDFFYLKHDVADNTAATRRVGMVMKAGGEDTTGASRSAALYLRSTAALFDSPTFRIDVRDTNMWDMQPNTSGSVTSYPVIASGTGAYFKSAPGITTGGLSVDSTWIGSQGSGLNQYFRAGTTGSGFYWYSGGIHSVASGDPGSGGTLSASLIADADTIARLTVPRLTVTRTDDADVNQTQPAFMIGALGSNRIQMDADEINAYDVNGMATLQVQADATGGILRLGNPLTWVRINDVRLTITTDGSEPPGSHFTGDIWIDSRSSGGVKTRQSGAWVKL